MSLFEKLNAAKKHDNTDKVPKKGWRCFFYTLINNFFKLMWVNMLFILFSLPLVTIPSAYCAMNKVIVILYCENRSDVFRDFFDEFKQSFFKSLVIGLIFAASLIAMILIVLTQNIQSLKGWLFNAIGIAILLFVTVVADYSFLMLCYLDIKLIDNIKNAFWLTIKNSARSLMMIIIPCILCLIIYLFLPFSFPFIFLILFSLNQLIVCNIAIEPIREFIILDN